MKRLVCLMIPLAAFVASCGSSSTPASSYDTSKYSVTVTYPDGKPVDNGTTSAQWCNLDTQNCFRPVKLNSNGVAENALDDANYIVHLNSLPEGYTYNPNGHYMNASKKHLDISLVAYSTFQSGSGSKEDRYITNQPGVYSLTFASAEDVKYVGFNPGKTGKASIESWAVSELSVDQLNPKVDYYGEDPSSLKLIGSDDSSGEGDNFLYTADVTKADGSLAFGVSTTALAFPVNLDIVLSI